MNRKNQTKFVYVLLALGFAIGLLRLSDTVQARALMPFEQAFFAPAPADKLSPQVQQTLNQTGEDEMLTVIVKLGDQADLSRFSNIQPRERRINSVINALQYKANATQNHIRALLETRMNQGTVAKVEYFWVFNGLAVTATTDVIAELAARPEVQAITPNAIILAPAGHEGLGPAETNLAVINTAELWHIGYQGQGVVVANMDTGVYLNHPDLLSKWRGGTNSWFDPNGEHPATPSDYNGHGTWTMGVMVGGDEGGTSIGVAPSAQWIAVKIFNDQGSATTAGIHAGYQWLLDPDGDSQTDDAPHVVNNSWTFQSPGCNLEFELDLQALRAAGILPVFAAGNSGPNSGTSVSPSNNPSAFAVGGTDDNDLMYMSSSRGPSSCGEPETIYPEMVAPGVDIHTTDLYGLYVDATGTSLSAPHVAGGLALLLSAFPNMTVDQQVEALISSAVDLGAAGPDNDYGNGRADLLAAYNWLASNNNNPTATPTPDPDVNLALNKPVSVSSSQDAEHDGPMAVDGDLSSLWQSARAKGKNKLPSEWITIDLGDNFSVSKVVLEWDANFATGYTIQISTDNNAWNTVYSTANGNGANDTISFSPVTARYIKLDTTAWSSGSLRVWLKEIQAFSGGGSAPTPTPPPAPTPTPTPEPGGSIVMHIGDLDGNSSSVNRGNWRATISIEVHDSNDNPVPDALVSGNWIAGISGSGNCTTAADGICQIDSGNIRTNISAATFSVSSVVRAADSYNASANHDPDGDSDGTVIVVTNP